MAVLRAIEAIAVGGSAGVLQPLLDVLLPALPAGLPAAVFVVVHIPRDRPSVIASLCRDRCALSVFEAEDKMAVRPGCVYVAPPDYHLLVDEGPVVALSADEPVQFSRPSIDVLFESVADAYGAHALGIVLTGASADGAAGLRAIHAAGGVTVVEDPAVATVPTMPAAARDAVPQSLALTIPQIAALLARLPSMP